MARVQNPNVEILMSAVERLGSLADELVFVGGCATGLLITDPAAPPVRVTRDVDVITEVASRSDYYQLGERLRSRGFVEDATSNVLCRWVSQEVILDVMPIDSDILGFSNRWYALAAKAAVERALPNGLNVRMVSAPYFLATKLEAFDGRGQGDYLLSHDIEDLVAVLDGRPEIAEEVATCEPALKAYLAQRFSELLESRAFLEALAGHMPSDRASQARLPILKGRIGAITDPGKE
ncbi:MAG: hypothetical protein JMN24_01730 [gamma proteobacterium endosymbiont of Lamellibrachia anaximandri]|nr:hypothetical protein [gamma proteobacterium endosymbiont of Lamellibrachia anaximandri]MBL3618747.1 hypothetical protein [gamma proteobacterium endosymbiont of Lamellibrachia anaximandri]